MPELIKSAKPRASKPHRCNCCTSSIPAGSTYDRDTYVYDGHVYDWKTCPDCVPLNDVVWRWIDPLYSDEGIGPDDYYEWASEHQDDTEHGEAACAFLARWDAARAGSGGSSAVSGVNSDD